MRSIHTATTPAHASSPDATSNASRNGLNLPAIPTFQSGKNTDTASQPPSGSLQERLKRFESYSAGKEKEREKGEQASDSPPRKGQSTAVLPDTNRAAHKTSTSSTSESTAEFVGESTEVARDVAHPQTVTTTRPTLELTALSSSPELEDSKQQHLTMPTVPAPTTSPTKKARKHDANTEGAGSPRAKSKSGGALDRENKKVLTPSARDRRGTDDGKEAKENASKLRSSAVTVNAILGEADSGKKDSTQSIDLAGLSSSEKKNESDEPLGVKERQKSPRSPRGGGSRAAPKSPRGESKRDALLRSQEREKGEGDKDSPTKAMEREGEPSTKASEYQTAEVAREKPKLRRTKSAGPRTFVPMMNPNAGDDAHPEESASTSTATLPPKAEIGVPLAASASTATAPPSVKSGASATIHVGRQWSMKGEPEPEPGMDFGTSPRTKGGWVEGMTREEIRFSFFHFFIFWFWFCFLFCSSFVGSKLLTFRLEDGSEAASHHCHPAPIDGDQQEEAQPGDQFGRHETPIRDAGPDA
jgi:hypothetical protein